jgi:hypothetical protein
VGFVPVEPAHINNFGQFSIAQIARNAQNMSIRYKIGTVQLSSVASRERAMRSVMLVGVWTQRVAEQKRQAWREEKLAASEPYVRPEIQFNGMRSGQLNGIDV